MAQLKQRQGRQDGQPNQLGGPDWARSRQEKPAADHGRCLVIACGALAKEIVALRSQLVLGVPELGAPGSGNMGPGDDAMTLQCLPAGFHNTPGKIAPAVEEILSARAKDFDTIFVAYGECGTGGALDKVLKKYGATRMAGAHCYEFYAGADLYEQVVEEQIGSFFLTDYLVKNFDRLVITGLGLDRFPHLRDDYFGNYTQLVYLSQTEDATLLRQASDAADRLGLKLNHIHVGYGDLANELHTAVQAVTHSAAQTVKQGTPEAIAESRVTKPVVPAIDPAPPLTIEQTHVRG